MAFTKTPIQSSYETKSVPLLYKWDSRNASADGYDTQFKNALVEPIGEEYFQVLKRNGVENVTTTPAITGTTVGQYYWATTSGTNYLVVVTLAGAGTGIVYMINTSTFAATQASIPIATLLRADSPVFFAEFLYQSGSVDLMISVESQLYKLTTAGVMTQIITAPAPGGRAIVYLDGYLFTHDDGNIWNSNLNDPTTWTAGSFLAADSYPDVTQRISRVGPYIVALGVESIQYFYDAANPTGTPLAANVGATKRVGYIGGLANFGDDLLFVGSANQGPPTVYRLSGLKMEPQQSYPFTRMWNTQNSLYSSVTPAPEGSILNLNGHTCYFVRTQSKAYAYPDTPPNVPVADTYYLDLDTAQWSKLSYQATDFLLIKQASSFSTVVTGTGGLPKMTYFITLGGSTVQRFSPTIYRDNAVNFEVKFRTKPQDFGNARIKFGGRLLVQGDQTNAASLAYVSWSDDDYQTTSTPRPIDMRYSYQQLYALGSFRKRSFTFTYSDNFPMRWKTIELDYDQGVA